eukprot:COSAG02_NODE_1444_length_12574_cov_17.452171_8_plen_110_part_00
MNQLFTHVNLWATDQADDHCEPPVRVVLEEKIEVLKERPGRQARDVRELGFALIRRCHNGETGWIRRCYLESVFKGFQKSESYVGDEEPRLSDGDLADSSSSSSSSDSD